MQKPFVICRKITIQLNDMNFMNVYDVEKEREN